MRFFGRDPSGLAGLAALLAVALLPAPFAAAQGTSQPSVLPREPAEARPLPGRPVTVMGGTSYLVDLDRDAKDLFIADPKVANAVILSPRRMVLVGLGEGRTNVMALDAAGRRVATFDITVARDLAPLREALRAAVPAARVRLTGAGDAVIVAGEAASAQDAALVMDIAKGFSFSRGDGTARPAGQVVNALTIRGRDQVMLKVTVAEVQRSVLKQLGIATGGEWQVSAADGLLDIAAPAGSLARRFAAPAEGSGAGSNAVSVKLRALEREGVMRTLAEPTLTTLSGETATFTAGGDVPVPGSEICTAGVLGQNQCSISVNYRPVGVALSFTPAVLTEGRISLKVDVSVTDIDEANGLQVSSVNAAAFKSRRMATTVELPSGASLMSAGLMQHTTSKTVSGLPGLVNVPVLGALFRSNDFQRRDSELLIAVTPFIARPLSPRGSAGPAREFQDVPPPPIALLRQVIGVYGGGREIPVDGYPGRAAFVIE
jgi:pilus assembly protein CpaC